MKLLDVSPFEEGIERNIVMLQRLGEEMTAIHQTVEGLVAMEDSLKGEGGNAIRSFYQECHSPFLLYFDSVSIEFVDILRRMSNALTSLESSPTGFIHQEFLEGDIEKGLKEIGKLTTDLTNEANSIMSQVDDIVPLPKLDDTDVQAGVRKAGIRRDETITQLKSFDVDQKGVLTSFEPNLRTMETWIADIESLFTEGLTDVDFSADSWKEMQKDTPIGELNNRHQPDSLSSYPRVTENDVEVATPNYGNNDRNDNAWAGLATTTGFNVNDWKETPINAFGSLGNTANSSYAFVKEAQLANKGFGISREKRVTAQGKEKVVIKLKRPDLIGVKNKTYSHTNATNYTKIFSRVDAKTNIKQSFKLVGNKIGYIGMGTAVVGDIYHGKQEGLTATEITGNVTGTVAVGGATVVASAFAAAKVGAMAGSFGGPAGIVAGAAVGLLASIVVPLVFSNIRLFDVDNDGKKDSFGETIQKGTTGLLNNISSIFK